MPAIGLRFWQRLGAPAFYILVTLPLVTFLALATPPTQVADEPNHFLRAVQISQGDIIGRLLNPDDAGGSVDAGAVRLAHGFDALPFHPERKLTPAMVEPTLGVRWSDAPRVEASFPNTVIYAPFAYVFAVAGTLLGKLAHMTVISSFLLARLCNGLGCVALSATAIGLARRGRMLLFLLLSLPMTLGLFASVSQDALLIALAALAAAWITRLADPDFTGYAVEWLTPAVLLGLCAAGKPNYGLLALPLLAASMSVRAATRSLASRIAVGIAVALIAVAIPLAWEIDGALPLKVAFRVADHVSVAGQLDFLLHHPFSVFSLVTTTLAMWGRSYVQEFVGILGWLDTPLNPGFYRIALAALAVALGATCLAPGGGVRGQGRLRLVTGAAMALTVASLFVLFYLAWTPVGEGSVEGVQGRYFLPIAMFLPLLFGPAGSATSATRLPTALAWLLVALVPLADLALLPPVILLRYYW